jgi:hypothetical protein
MFDSVAKFTKTFCRICLCFLIICCWGYIYKISYAEISVSPYPNGKNFAFTITDDPDGAIYEKVKLVYHYLDCLGFKTTIACWVFKPKDLTGLAYQDMLLKTVTLEDSEYVALLKGYQSKGFEIALHTATAGNDIREITKKGYEEFINIFGEYPKINIMHSKNKENIYWGKQISTNPVLKWLVGFYDKTPFSGENEKSPYFWGDICKAKTKYVRMWGAADINTLKFNPSMPYHDSLKPFVNFWFSFSDGVTGEYFNRLLSYSNVKRLVNERGASIVYTHFASGFCRKRADGSYVLNNRTKEVLLNLSKQKDGWFVPAGVLLDRLKVIKDVKISYKKNQILVTNVGNATVQGITLLTRPGILFTEKDGSTLETNAEGEITVGDLIPLQTKIYHVSKRFRIISPPYAPGFIENCRLVWERVRILIFNHRG